MYTLIFPESFLAYLYDEVWGPDPETELSSQDLLCFFNSGWQRQHQGSLVYQLVLVVFVLKGPLQNLNCRQKKDVEEFALLFPSQSLLGFVFAGGPWSVGMW